MGEKKLLVLANEFPYGTWEPYMETEEPYYSDFDKTWIASLQLRSEHAKTKRNLSSGATVIPVWYKSRLFYFLNAITVLADRNLYVEIGLLRKKRMFSFSRLVDLFVFLSRAHHEARVISNALRGEDKDNLLIYSYRFEYQPYVAMLLKRNWKSNCSIISRAHRYDLYEDQHTNKYIPLREVILSGLDYVFPCSENGTEYVKKNYNNAHAKIETRYLGTKDYGIHEYISENVIRIVSCSNVVKVKRLNLIIDALSALSGKTDKQIEWTHYGDGVLMDEIRSYAAEKLNDKKNISYIFKGNVQNKDLMKEYKEKNYYLFINVSSSEGLPVSIMEAMSFGIPCIATDIGGTREIVDNDNGVLLSPNVNSSQISMNIDSLMKLKFNDYKLLRDNARENWNKKFNAKSNYDLFFERLSGIKNEKSISCKLS